MTNIIRTLACAAILALPVTLVAQKATGETPDPQFVDQLANELGASDDQAIGAAGSMFGLAKTRMKPADFAKVAAVVPGMNTLLAAAPAIGASGGLAGVAGSFSKLGLKPDQVSTAASFLTQYVTKSGGPAVGSLLAAAFK